MTLPLSVVGQRVPRVDVVEKVTGKAIYAMDLKLVGMLYGKIKRSPYPFARILSIDTSAARALPGVKAVVTGKEARQYPYGGALSDELPLAAEYARYYGEEVAAVAAVDADIAEEAVELIKVEYEELKPVLDPEHAMDPDAPAVHPELDKVKNNVILNISFSRGQGEAAFSQAEVIVEDTFITPTVHPGHIEPHACVSVWDPAGRLTLYCPSQGPFRIRSEVARAVGLPEASVRVLQTYVGGGFGGKGGRHPQRPYAISALLARAAGKPVKVEVSWFEELMAGRPRQSTSINIKMGFKRDGTIVAKKVLVLSNAGAYSGSAVSIFRILCSRLDSLYRIPNIKVMGNLVFTNTIHRGAFRGLGGVQMITAIESLMDLAAVSLGIDPRELRLKNAVQEGDISPRGWVFDSCHLSESIETAARMGGWAEKRLKSGTCRGIGMASEVWNAGNRDWHPVYDGSGAIVRILETGKIQLITGEAEIGQGSNTVFCQIIAEELQQPMSEISVGLVDTDSAPFCLGTGASRVTVLGGSAVYLAATEARQQLMKYAAQKLGVKEAQVRLRDGHFCVEGSDKKLTFKETVYSAVLLRGGVPIMGIGAYVVPESVVSSNQNSYGNQAMAYTFSTQVVEVEVDAETGLTRVLGIWDAEDIGKAVNPTTAEGQIEGAMMQGMGYALTEEYIFNKGIVMNPNLHDYKMAVAPDIPPIHIRFIEKGNPGTPYGVKGVGEGAILPTGPAIGNAIYHATGIRMKEFPITPERLLRAIRERQQSTGSTR